MAESLPGDLFQPGDLVNNTYRVEAILGRGGTSDVYRARSEISGRLMALKVLKTEFANNDDYLVLLKREETMREIRHDAVVRYSENNRTPDGHVYLLIDYVDGPGLDKKLKQGPMTADDLLVICRRVAEGLQAAHAHNICHRDLSPDNIILRDGDPAQAVIIDFGIAKDTNPGAETIVGNEFAGKYAYAAPEQLAGTTDERTDIYSLGALLLANFRGKSPNIGNNPMEVVQKKAERLDTEGVPEPLKSMLDKMTDPDPNNRYQSATEVLAALSGQPVPPAEDDPLADATIIAPLPQQPATAKSEPAKETARSSSAHAGKKAFPVLPVVGALVVVVGIAAAFLSGIFTSAPPLPTADPYRLSIAQAKDTEPRAVGFVPSEEMAETIRSSVQSAGGSTDLTLATGAIAESWAEDVLGIFGAVAPLDVWRISIDGNDVEIEGETTSQAVYDDIQSQLSGPLVGALNATTEIRLNELILATQKILPVLQKRADCGPLVLVDPPATGYALGATIGITGTLASPESHAALLDALRGVIGDREVRFDTNTLNPTLCLIESVLPKAPTSDIGIQFYQGDLDNAPNPTGEFIVGENPVIDVVIPDSVADGYLSVSVLDVSGNVFHLLPNINRADNSVESLRKGADGAVPVRVAYSIAEAQSNGGLAFRVDDSTLGKTKIIALHSNAPLFDEMRPTSESALSYSEALLEQMGSPGTEIYSLDSEVLTTALR